MKCLLRFTDRANRKNLRLDPQEVAFLNPNSLVFIDDKFFSCPCLTLYGWRNCACHCRLSVNVTADVIKFLGEMQDARFDLRRVLWPRQS